MDQAREAVGAPQPPGGAAARGDAPIAPRETGPVGYRHVRYDEPVTFDFLLPLTREDRLRRSVG